MIALFEEKERNDKYSVNSSINKYEYIDLSDSEIAAQQRSLLNKWFDRYPDHGKVELKNKLMADFHAAYFELFLHEYFLKLGFDLEPHPDIPESTKHPDYLVRGYGLEFYLEAKQVETPKTVISRNNRLLGQYNTLNTIDTPNYFFAVSEITFKSNNTSRRQKLVRSIKEELMKYDSEYYSSSELEVDTIRREITFEDDDMKIIITLIPKSKNIEHNSTNSSIGIYPIFSYVAEEYTSLFQHIKGKSKKYGSLDKPYLICINSFNIRNNYEAVVSEFYKEFQIPLFSDPLNFKKQYSIKTDPSLLNINKPKYQTISAIMVSNVHVDFLNDAINWIVEHPNPYLRLSLDTLQLPKTIVCNDSVTLVKGKSITEIINPV
jgi:hypothetical protein